MKKNILKKVLIGILSLFPISSVAENFVYFSYSLNKKYVQEKRKNNLPYGAGIKLDFPLPITKSKKITIDLVVEANTLMDERLGFGFSPIFQDYVFGGKIEGKNLSAELRHTCFHSVDEKNRNYNENELIASYFIRKEKFEGKISGGVKFLEAILKENYERLTIFDSKLEVKYKFGNGLYLTGNGSLFYPKYYDIIYQERKSGELNIGVGFEFRGISFEYRKNTNFLNRGIILEDEFGIKVNIDGWKKEKSGKKNFHNLSRKKRR